MKKHHEGQRKCHACAQAAAGEAEGSSDAADSAGPAPAPAKPIHDCEQAEKRIQDLQDECAVLGRLVVKLQGQLRQK